MPAFILKILGPLAPYLAATAGVLGLLLYVSHLRHELATAQMANQALQAVNAQDAAAIAAGQKQQAAMNAALDTLGARTVALDMGADAIQQKIIAAPPGDNAPVAPVLARALDALRALQSKTP